MLNHGESSIVILTRAWARTEDYWEAYFYLLEGVRKNFDKYGILFPFNQLDVHITNERDINEVSANENKFIKK